MVDKNIDKILIVNLGGIGDFFFSTPALRALKGQYPHASLVFLGVPRTSEVARLYGDFSDVFSFPGFDEKNRRFGLGNFWKILKFLLRLRRERFDVAINMRTIVSSLSALKMAVIFLLIGARIRVGRNTEGRGFFFHRAIKESRWGDRHELDYDCETVALLGVEVVNRSVKLPIEKDIYEDVRQKLFADGLKEGEILIGIHAGGAQSKRWPIDRWVQVLKALAAKVPCCFVMVGGAGEEKLYEEISRRSSVHLINRIHQTTFAELAALISQCRLFIGNDSGLIHIAAILKVPLVAIFGAGYLTRFDPRKISDRAIVLYRKAKCAPCDKVQCRDLKCLKDIRHEDVIESALKLLELPRMGVA